MSEQRVLVVGALGRMGERVRAALEAEPGAALGGALEAPGHPSVGDALASGIAITDDPKAALSGCDAVIDFSLPESTLRVLRAAADAGVACVVGTTGFNAEQEEEFRDLAKRTPVVRAANFSVSVNVLGHLVSEAARLLGEDFDAEIVELHHAAKRDAPSGTALWLGGRLAEARGRKLADLLTLVREGDTGERKPGSIGIQAQRGGDAPGEHTVMFFGQGERVELVHRSFTRDHFARGAVRAALWVAGKPPGLYSMKDVLGI